MIRESSIMRFKQIYESLPIDSLGRKIWNRAKDKDGYGLYSVSLLKGGQKQYRAHRLAYLIYVGDIPEELQLWINKYNEKVTMLDTLRSQVSALREENEILVEKYQELCTEESNLHKEFEKFKANHKEGVDRENELSLVILSLKKAMLAGAASDYQNQLEELLNLITDLAKIK